MEKYLKVAMLIKVVSKQKYKFRIRGTVYNSDYVVTL